jgi:uroporphyrinogen-III synthase
MSDAHDGTDQKQRRVVYTGTSAPDDVPDALELIHAPMLASEAIEVDTDRLAELVDRPAGLVVYSRNAIRALDENGARDALAPLDHHDWWAVGDKTAALLAETFGVEARVPDQQNFDGLSDALEGADDLPERVISLSLEGKFRNLAPVVDPRGVEFHDIPVYRTVGVDYEPPYDEFRDADWLVFTSPRGVRHFFDLEDETPPPLSADVRIAAIGPKTAGALRDHGREPDFVPDEPSKAAIVEAIADRHSDTGT